MNTSKSTRFLVNLALVLVIALLLRSLISVPKSLSAGSVSYYHIVSESDLDTCIDENWRQGWKLTAFSWDNKNDNWKVVFER